MKSIYTTCLSLVLLYAASGCGDFLEEKSQDEVIPKTAEDLSMLLLGSGYPWGNDNTYNFLYLMDDNISLNGAHPSLSGNTTLEAGFGAYTWQPDMNELPATTYGVGTSSNAYTSSYLRIMGCNAVLDLIDESEGTPYLKAKVKAEALAIRAYYYFCIVNTYAAPYNVSPDSPGVPLKLTSGVEESPMSRHTVSEVYRQVVRDLTEAINLLKDEEVTTEDFHINLPSMYVLLSRVYLFMEEWNLCAEAATSAIQCGGSLTDMRSFASMDPLITYKVPEVLWIYGKAEYASYISSSIIYAPSDELMGLFDREKDARFRAFFTEGAAYNYSTWTTYKGWYVLKHDASSYASLGQCIRLSEAYLNRAEAYARQNDSRAAADINALRRYRIDGYQDAGSVTIEEVLTERRKELCFEQPRWFDLRRCGRPAVTHVWPDDNNRLSIRYELKENDPMYVIPIPSGALEHNSLLTQNSSADAGTREGVYNAN